MVLAPLEQFQILSILPCKLFGLDFSITNFLFMIVIVIVSIFSIIYFKSSINNSLKEASFYFIANSWQKILDKTRVFFMSLYKLFNHLQTTFSYHLVASSTKWALFGTTAFLAFSVSLMCIERLAESEWILPLFHLNLTSIMSSSNSILATSPLPALPTRSATIQWVFSMSTLLLPYLALAQSFLVLTTILIFSLFFFFNSGQKNSLFLKVQKSFKALPLINKIFLITFTFSVAIPNKICINNNIKPLSMFFITFIFLSLGPIYPFIYCLYFMYIVFTLESFVFGILYEYFPNFRKLINKVLFNSFTSDDELSREFLEFFWGNMFKAAQKLAPTLIAAGGTTAAVITQRNQEITARDQTAHNDVTKQIEIDKNNNIIRPEGFYTKLYRICQEEWEKTNGVVLRAERIVQRVKQEPIDPTIKAELSATTDKALKTIDSQRPSATSPITSDWFFDWF